MLEKREDGRENLFIATRNKGWARVTCIRTTFYLSGDAESCILRL